MLLLLLYFTDYKGAMAASGVFAALTSLFTVISLGCFLDKKLEHDWKEMEE